MTTAKFNRYEELKNIILQIRNHQGAVKTNIPHHILHEIGFGYLIVRKGECKHKNLGIYIAQPYNVEGFVRYSKF